MIGLGVKHFVSGRYTPLAAKTLYVPLIGARVSYLPLKGVAHMTL